MTTIEPRTLAAAFALMVSSGLYAATDPRCDENAAKNAIRGPLGYAERVKPIEADEEVQLNGVAIDIEPYCEGFWRKLIADGDNADDLRVTQAMITRDLNAIQATGSEASFWVLAWPFLAPDWGSGMEAGSDPVVKIKGFSSRAQQQYQLDSSEDSPATPDRSFAEAPPVELFAWKSEVLTLSEEQQALALNETRYRVIRFGTVRGVQGEEIIMPTVLNPSGPVLEDKDLAINLRVQATRAQAAVESVSIRVLRSDLADFDKEVKTDDLKLRPAQQRIWIDTDQRFAIPIEGHGGRTIEVTFYFASDDLMKRESVYLYVPTREQIRSMQQSLQP